MRRIKALAEILWGLLRELSDESPYRRHLAAHRDHGCYGAYDRQCDQHRENGSICHVPIHLISKVRFEVWLWPHSHEDI